MDLTLQRLRKPEPELLALLEKYEQDAFGPLGLRSCDFAVLVEAGAVFLACRGGKIVGACELMRDWDRLQCCYLVGIYVRPPWQGQGVGRWLLHAAAEECRAVGMEEMVLTVAPDNSKALALYRSVGFVEETFIPHFYGQEGDRYLMRWRWAQPDLPGSV